MKAQHQELLAVGKVVKAFGIRGDIVVQPMTDSPARFKKLRVAQLGNTPGDVRAVAVQHVRIEPRGVRMKIAGVIDRSAAERLVGQILFVDEEHRMRPPRGSYFVHDLLGISVVDQEGRNRGEVTEVLKMPAHDVYVVKHCSQEFMIPAVKEFIVGIDLRSRRMKVRLIEGMVEE